ncbi:hypothetical protein BST95_01895 [Halioglobus japonicus]|uniref:DUF1145 domain-containing protein n=1 Tax=Halioglobus japonicus TaxID=930805 RepID=A0AAP8SM60_9GAMM|nr:hypothetical protein [Halioglobus japonicus]AQA17154.1 hypothetical protein BST95_01895 [Halioglobus japonicus]PLW85066.1 hypothetical protein C0029_16160 [Halioglobus japonicus]GHD19288.1 hypothetical protein GCM10007052_27560 [Halioglobus japonicus]
MSTNKWIALAVYAGLAIYGIGFASPEAAKIVMYIFIALPIIHVLEFLLVLKVLKSAGGSMGGHFLQTLIFGYVHWLPIWKTTRQ